MKRLFKLLLKSILWITAIIVVLLVVLKLTFNEDIPTGEKGAAADALAYKILDAINHKEFTQAAMIEWTFRGKNKYRWKLQENLVDIYWDDYRVAYSTRYPQGSFAFKNEKRLEGDAYDQAMEYAIENFNNDSFWVVAPHKIMDIGTDRELVTMDDKQQLLVRYNSGGSTPGDVYLWQVDDNYVPQSFKMWVSIIPLDGIKASFTDWKKTDADFMLANQPQFYGINIPITDLKVTP